LNRQHAVAAGIALGRALKDAPTNEFFLNRFLMCGNLIAAALEPQRRKGRKDHRKDNIFVLLYALRVFAVPTLILQVRIFKKRRD
jgi:hypothetical protein